MTKAGDCSTLCAGQDMPLKTSRHGGRCIIVKVYNPEHDGPIWFDKHLSSNEKRIEKTLERLNQD